MIYPDTFEHKVGFDAVRQMIAAHCISTLGQARCAEMAFTTDFGVMSRLLTEIDEMMKILAGDRNFPLAGIHDLTSQLKGIRALGTHIAEADLLRLRTSLEAIVGITAFFSAVRDAEGHTPYPALDAIAQRFGMFAPIMRDIDRLIDKFGNIKDNASPELARIRNSLTAMQGSINSAMRRVISQAIKDGLLDADTSPAIRDGRPVIPVSPMNKRKIPGIVHDESASGMTYFIEPAAVVEANNRLRELQMDERREVLRLLVDLADRLRPHVPELLEAYDMLADFDFIHAKARFAAEIGATMPRLHPQTELEWYHACHPVLKLTLEKQGKEVVPLDIWLTDKQRILVISGPNAGGKSVTLKTVAIVQYMAQCGVMPPVFENSHVGVFDGIFIDIGDDQSIENELSTYSSHLRNMKFFLTHGSDRTMALIDEFGGGTEPQIGGAIAQAVLARFLEMGMWGVITTHFQNLKRYAGETPGLANGSMLYDRQLMLPLFRLSIGTPGSSFAIEIARKTGLPETIIKSAEQIVGSDYINLDKYLLDIARDRRYWENKRQQIKEKEKRVDALMEKYEADAETLRLKRREIIDEARSQAKEILDKSNAAVERTIHDIKTANAERERTLEARQKLEREKRAIAEAADPEHPMLKKKRKTKGQTEPKPKVDAKPLAVGDHVQLDGAGTVGEILEINGNSAVVAFGNLKTTAKLNRLRHTLKQIPSAATKTVSIVSKATTEAIRERQLNFKPDIDVRGMRVDEAVQAITYFIDDATQFNAGRVRILHGTGTGALRQYIRDYLATVPSVAAYRDEDVRFGGAGITIVDLN